jgi:hypothetical protein
MHDRLVCDVFVDDLRDVYDRRLVDIPLDDWLDSLVDVVVRELRCAGFTLDRGTLEVRHLLLVLEPGFHAAETVSVALGHLHLAVQMFGIELLGRVGGRQGRAFFDGLHPQLVVVLVMFRDQLLVDFYLFDGVERFLGRFRVNVRLDRGVMSSVGSKNLVSSFPQESYFLDLFHVVSFELEMFL